jgi:capsular polysaccharide biosynthesis protein
MAGSNYTSSRKVLNYDELKIVLDEFGFKSYELENLSFQKQVEIFSSADIVMGPHGAGLVNMIFSEDPVVIELFPENKLKPHFYFICEMMDFSYRGVIMDSEKSDLVVDTDDLRVQLQSVTEDI